jgi:arsenate reductase
MNILYICTHNRCRSILSEAITRQKAQGVINAQSAGSQPVGEVHPLSLRYLQESGYGVEGLRPKSWENLSNENGHDFIPDVVITVCDQAAGESCPSKLDGTDAQKREAFLATIHEIEQRVDKLMAIAKLDKEQQLAALTQLTQAF